MITIEITATTNAAGDTTTLYLSDDRFQTSATDTPAKKAFDPLIIDPGSIGRSAYSDGATGGATKLETGEIVLANIDGALDYLLDYGFDGQPVVIHTNNGIAVADYPADWTDILSATIESVETTADKFTFRLRDKQWVLKKPVCDSIYAGTNSLPNGLEGIADDIKGQRKPKVFGAVLGVSPPWVNTSRLIYEVGVCNSVDAVYDRALALNVEAVYTDQSDMETNAPTAGAFRAWPAGGYFRLGSSATGQITADVTAGANAAARTTAQVIEELALAAGLAAGEISSSDITALDTANAAVVGIWLQDETDYISAMDQIAEGISAYYGFDSAGVLRMGRLTAPTGTAALTINDYDVLALERRPARDNGVPAWRYTLYHTKNYTRQSGDIAGAVTDVRRAYIAQEWRSTTAADAAIKDKHLLAQEMEAYGLMILASAADTEAARRLALYDERRDILDVTIPLEILGAAKLMDVVKVVYPRFGCTAGKDFRLIGIRYELAQRRAVLTLWG